ncbi:MAG: DASS family sodium-coupled anion symporter [Fibrobacterales bacterium]|nr:DASS family sodium-coupled anion symporter [Fibrobacterales bacterium]
MNKSKLIKLLICAVLAIAALYIPFDRLGVTINPVEQRVVAMFVFAAFAWILEPVPIFSTSILIIVLMLFTISNKALTPMMVDANGEKFKNLLSFKDVMATWADPTIMLFMGGFFLAAAATKFKLDLNLARVLIKPFGKNPRFVLLGMMMTVAIFSMFMSNTATAAMFLAILTPVLAVFKPTDKARIAFALAIPIGCNLGGMGTPIGTPPNAIAVKALADLGLNISFGQWMLFAVPFMLVMLVFGWFLLLKLFPPSEKTMELSIAGEFLKTPQAIVVYVTFAVTILLWVFGDLLGLNSNVIAMIPIAAFTLTGVITAKDLNGMAWDVLWLVAGGFALGLGLQKTGLAAHLLAAIPFDALPIMVTIFLASFIAIFMSTFMSNSGTAALLAPIMAAAGAVMAASPAVDMNIIGGIPGLLCALAFSCSLAMSLPISTPPNSLAYATKYVETKDMAKMGVIIGIVGLVLTVGTMGLLGKFGYFNATIEAAEKAKAAEAAKVEAAAPAAPAAEATVPAVVDSAKAEAVVDTAAKAEPAAAAEAPKAEAKAEAPKAEAAAPAEAPKAEAPAPAPEAAPAAEPAK